MNRSGRDKRTARVARLWLAGLSLREIGRQLGIHHQTAADDLKRHQRNLARPSAFGRTRAAVRDRRAAKVARLLAEGLSLRQAAAELGVSYQTVANDRARWRQQHANVIPLSRNGVSFAPPRGQKDTPEIDSG